MGAQGASRHCFEKCIYRFAYSAWQRLPLQLIRFEPAWANHANASPTIPKPPDLSSATHAAHRPGSELSSKEKRCLDACLDNYLKTMTICSQAVTQNVQQQVAAAQAGQ